MLSCTKCPDNDDCPGFDLCEYIKQPKKVVREMAKKPCGTSKVPKKPKK